MLMIVLSVSVLWVYSFSMAKYTTFMVYDDNSSTNFLRMIDYPIVGVASYFDYISAAWFTFEVCIRYIVAPKKREFLARFDNYIDIIATVWFYFDLPLHAHFSHNAILYFFDSVRVFRLIRLLDYHPGLKIIITSIKQSANVLALLLLVATFSGVIYGTIVYYVERLTTSEPDLNEFETIMDGIWYSVVTLT
jgi:hypothetical protein